MKTHSYPGRGAYGIGTNGNENFNTIISRPDIAGKDTARYRPRNPGIKISQRKAPKKSRIVNPKI